MAMFQFSLMGLLWKRKQPDGVVSLRKEEEKEVNVRIRMSGLSEDPNNRIEKIVIGLDLGEVEKLSFFTYHFLAY